MPEPLPKPPSPAESPLERVSTTASDATVSASTAPTVRFGVDQLCDEPTRFPAWGRVGMITNEAARLASDSAARSRSALLSAGFPLVRLFGPEHGLIATADDGAAVADGVDAPTGMPVVSLYGERMRPSPDALADLDALLFDVPDVGARFYTYTWTLYHALAACADAGVPLVVLDRPNPQGGLLAMAEGPMLEASCRSFLGETRIPIRHQLTLGELARLWQREEFPTAILHVVPVEGWSRAMRWPETGLPWVPTSPAMPSFESASLYAGTCLLEATNLSVGRGTAWPFRWIGAPWLDADRLLDAFAQRQRLSPSLAAIGATPLQAEPTSSLYAGERCRGILFDMRDAALARPVALGVHLLASLAATHPIQFAWARYPTAANPTGDHHLARLFGRTDAEALLSAQPVDIDEARVDEWTRADAWESRVTPILLYD